MNICFVTNHRNSSIFAESLSTANKQLGNITHIFELNYSKPVQDERDRLIKMVETEMIQLVLFLNDFKFPNQNFFLNDEISKEVECRLWVWDAMHDMDELKDHIHLYSKIFSFEINDVLQLEKNYSIQALYLPLYAGPNFYANPRSIKGRQDIDLFFIGTIAGSEKRLGTLEAVAKLAYKENYKMLVLGRIWHSHHWWQEVIGKIKFYRKYPYLAKVVKNKVLNPHEVISYYKRTKINLNIHIEGHTGYNCRTFEIMGNQNFVLSDKQDKCGLELEEGRNFDSYDSIEDMLEKIEYYLNHDEVRNKIAANGGNLIREKYNLVNALRIILS